jgi:acyl dehydratase
VSRHAGPAPPGDTLTTWRERNRHALREFWARVPAYALGVKQEFEKALAQDGKPTK